ncbi:hypothetical protein [Ohtaekwangia sp.]|uniref:hypothetical protein n=1 Tax=Ohtaekwangia sp. TaxID=2066019 RepID=UPI002FDCECBC
MALAIILYQYTGDAIRITIEARFEDDKLIIDGYDIGARVKEYWGDSDYEYSIILQPESINQLGTLLNLSAHDKQMILQALAKRFNTNSCFSEIQKLLDDHHISYESFRWT